MRTGRLFPCLAVTLMAAAGGCGGDEAETGQEGQTPPAATTAPLDTTMAQPVPPAGTPAAAPGVPPGAAPAGSAPAPGAAPAASTPAPAAAPGGGNTAALAQAGAQLYGSSVCVSCHGPNGQGTALAPNLADDEWLWFQRTPTQAELVTLIKTGVSTPKQHPAPMPANGGMQLSDQQLQQLSAYILSL